MAAQAQPQTNGAAHEAPQGQAIQPPAKSKNFELLELIASQDIGLQQDYTRQLVEVEIDRARFDQQARLAKAFANSGMFADIKGKNEEQALATAQAKIEMGRSWAMNAGDAMQFIYFVNGRPAIMNEYYAGAIIRAGFWWDIKWDYQKDSKVVSACTLYLKVKNNVGDWERVKNADGSDASATFNDDDMRAAGFAGKDTYKAWKQDMFYWRAMARLRKFYCPNVLAGAMSVAEAQDLDPIIDETERQRAEERTIVPPKLKTAARERSPESDAAEHEEAVAEQEQQAQESAGVDPTATVTDARADEVRMALDNAGFSAKEKTALWQRAGVGNAYQLSNAQADEVLAECERRKKG